MKKIVIVLALVIICLASCQSSDTTNTKQVKANLTYFKDDSTGLCFASVNSLGYSGFTSTSITCVPCDSLKNVTVE